MHLILTEVKAIKLVSYEFGIDLLERSPPQIRNSIESTMRLVPRRLLFGKAFEEKLGLLKTSQRWKLKDLEEYQLQHLKKIIDHAYRAVPHYHNILKGRGLHPGDFSAIKDLKKMPILTKEEIRGNLDDMKSSDSITYRPGIAFTSGSTGRPLEFLLDQQNREIELASVWRHISWAGVEDVNCRVACFRGSFVADKRTASPKLWRWDGKLGELTFNTYDLNFSNAKKMVKKLNDFKPEIIRSYPHSLFILCKLIERSKDTSIHMPKMIQTSSEHLTLSMRECIESTFGAKIFDWYSQSEDVISAGQCEYGLYHQTMETGIMDIFEDEWGMERLLGTGLWNYSMPLINYEIGDNVTTDHESCNCGRHHVQLKSIEGRMNDILITPDGRAISGVGFDHYYKHTILKDLKNIPEYFKMTQMTRYDFSVEVFVNEELSEADYNQIRDRLMELLGSEATIRINRLDAIPESKKWRILESKIDIDTLCSTMEHSAE
jgi:phenylacetate-CoA ligase